MIYDQSQQGSQPLRRQGFIERVQPCDSRWTFCSGMNPKGRQKARLPWQLWAKAVKQSRTVSEFSSKSLPNKYGSTADFQMNTTKMYLNTA